MKQAIEHLKNNEIEQWAILMLEYYDDFYTYGMEQREKDSISYVEIENGDYAQQVKNILIHKEMELK